MRNRIILLTCVVMIVVLSVSTSSQTKAQKVEINKLIGIYSAKTITALNKNRERFKYKSENKNVFWADINDDGEFDAIAEIFFCERTSCHPTTNSSEVVVFLNKKGKFTLGGSKGFSLFGKIHSVENGKIKVDVYDLDENDPQCCPELKRHETYSFKSNRLLKVKN
ncbi:MAG: hypothetical protein H7070_06590 [Saprospiraceae bacterium]|nr:hypothetical protein [Pyrinomonadaceae bacterium]